MHSFGVTRRRVVRVIIMGQPVLTHSGIQRQWNSCVVRPFKADGAGVVEHEVSAVVIV